MKRLVFFLLGAALWGAASGAFAFTDDECELDSMMNERRIQLDKMAVGIYENNVTKPIGAAIESAPTVKAASCLPVLDKLDALMRMRIPSMGGVMGGIMTKIADMACSAANSYLSNMANSVQIGYSDPYGIASVGIGGSTNGGGTQVETYDVAEVAARVAENAARAAMNKGSSEAGQVVRQLPSGAPNRTQSIESRANSEVNSAINGL